MNKQIVFFVSVREKGYGTEEIILHPFFSKHRYLTIGKGYECDITANSFGNRRPLLVKKKSDYYLIIHPDMDGDITIGDKTVALNWLTRYGHLKKRGKNYLFPLPEGSRCVFKIGDHALTFDYKEIIVPNGKAVKIDRSLKRPWFSKENFPFNAILLLFALINILSVQYLESLKLKKKEPMEVFKKIPQRFAKLILHPPQKKVLKKEILIRKPKEQQVIKEEKDLKKEELPPPEAKKEAPPVKEKPSLPEEKEKPLPPAEPESAAPTLAEKVPLEPEIQPPLSAEAKREIIREKVKHRGLLGVITAKARSDENLDQGVFREIDKFAGKIGKGDSEEREENIIAGLVDKSRERVNKRPGIILNSKPKRGKPRKTADIIKEKKEILLKPNKTEKKKEKVIVNHKRNEGDVHKTIFRYVGGLKYLYNNALKNNSLLKGSITVKMTISPDGKIIKAEKVSTTLNYSSLENAIIKRIYKWRFPPIKNAADYKITYTFDFSPLG